MRVIIDLRSPSGAGLQGHEGRDESVALSLNKVLMRERVQETQLYGNHTMLLR